VAVAVSGGVDSVALLLLLLELREELGAVLSVAHVNHQLRGEESDEDELFVAVLARRHDLELHSKPAPIGSGAGIEVSARKARYDFFRLVMRDRRVSKVATAHTLDDQAETVLLRLLRGAGIRGLAGIHPRLHLRGPRHEEQGNECGEVIRPLLQFRRSELKEFLRERGQPWREDSSNLDLSFRRNRVRHRVLPLLREDFGDASVENLADLAEIARAEEEHWQQNHPELLAPAESIELAWIETLPLAARRRLIRNWLEAHAEAAGVSYRMVEEILDLTSSGSNKTLELPGGHLVRRTRAQFRIELVESDVRGPDYEYSLPMPGEVELPEVGIRLQASLVNPQRIPETGQDLLLDQAALPSTLAVRNWRPGDRFWPAHTKEARKVKELLNDRHIVGAEKKLWPVLVAGDELVWVRGFAVPAKFRCRAPAGNALVIREIPLRS